MNIQRLHPAAKWRSVLALALALSSPAGMLAAGASLSVANTPGYPGTTVAVPLQLLRATNVTAAQYDIAFNPAKVTAGALELAFGASNHVLRSREIAPGVFRVLLYSLNNATTSNRVAASMPFAVPAEERIGSGPITPGNVKLSRPDASAVTPVATSSGQIFVRNVNPLPDGTVQFFLPSQPDTRYLVQATTDFVTWVNLLTNTATGSFMDLVDADGASYPHRFYRWILSDAAGQIGSVTQLPGGELSFQLTGLPGRTYVLQASANLQQWTDLSTNVATTGTLNFTNQISAAFPQRFFRLKSP